MSISTVSGDSYKGYVDKNRDSKKAEKKADSGKTESAQAAKVSQADAYEASKGRVVNKMSATDRAALVQQLKEEQARREQQLMQTVQKMVGQQGNAFGEATDMWKFLASGKYTVDAETKLQAQKDIAEDGYWGVKQTSERIFDFAQALAGDDQEKMKKMQAAFEKGFKAATGVWGKELPDICAQTREAVNKKFEDYFKGTEAVKTETDKAAK